MKIDLMGTTIIEIVYSDTKEDFPFTPGIYTLGEYSATGKTRLYKLALKVGAYDKSIVAYTYSDILQIKKQNKTLERMLGTPSEDVKLIIFDRADMYHAELKTILSTLKERHMILVDCKTAPLGRDTTMVNVRLDNADRITILV